MKLSGFVGVGAGVYLACCDWCGVGLIQVLGFGGCRFGFWGGLGVFY